MFDQIEDKVSIRKTNGEFKELYKQSCIVGVKIEQTKVDGARIKNAGMRVQERNELKEMKRDTKK